MKNLIIIVIVSLLPSLLSAQARITNELKQRLDGKTQFDEIKSEVKSYYRQEKLKLSPIDSLQQRSVNRQLKFWSRWFYESESRLDPDGTVANWSKRMLEADDDLMLDNNRAANSSWALVGPTNVNANDGIGRVLRLGFHPTNDQYIYAGAARGGLWLSTNGGTSWSSLSSFLPSLGVSGIEVNQTNPNTIYVLSGEGDAWLSGGYTSTYGYVSFCNGVFKSTDGGSNWSKTAEFSPGLDSTRYVGFQMRQDPNNSNTYIVATSAGIFRTTNGGSSWATSTFNDTGGFPLPSENTVGAVDIEYKPGSSTILYAACRIFNTISETFRFRFFRSTNSGVTFQEVNLGNEIDEDLLIRFEIGVTPVNPSIVFLLCGPGNVLDGDGSDDTFLGFLKSTNSGTSFTTVSTSPDVFAYNPSIGPTLGHQCMYDMALAVSPTNANIIFTGGLVVFRSTNGGADFNSNTTYWTWETGDHIHPDVHDLRFNELNGNLYAATDGGVFVTTDNGSSWSPIFNGMSITQFYHSEPDNENDKLWGGTQDNGIMEQQSGGTFSEFAGGDGFDVMTDNVVGDGNDSYWSTNGGLYTSGNFGDLNITPPDPSAVGRDYGTLDMHPANEDYIYVGYSDAVWYSNQRGDSWTISGVNNRLAGGVPSGDWSIQTCNSNNGRLYAAGSGSMWRIDNINFNNSATGIATDLHTELFNDGFPGNSSGSVIRKVTDILVQSNNSFHVWVSAGGFYSGKKVFYSEDAGVNWVNISYNLPNVPANCLLRDSDGTIYVGMDMGVFYLPSGENNWMPYYNALPRVPVTEMNFVADYLYASTYGRGIWKSQTFTGCTTTVNITQNLRGQRFYQASSSITSTSLVDGGAGTKVYFQTGNSITLNTGFEGKKGIVFTGYIQPCNTGPLPGNMQAPDSHKQVNAKEPMYAVIEAIESLKDHAEITLLIHKSGQYSLQFFSEDGHWIKDLQPAKEYQPGKIVIGISNDELAKGFHHIALMGDESMIHYQECNIP